MLMNRRKKCPTRTLVAPDSHPNGALHAPTPWNGVIYLGVTCGAESKGESEGQTGSWVSLGLRMGHGGGSFLTTSASLCPCHGHHKLLSQLSVQLFSSLIAAWVRRPAPCPSRKYRSDRAVYREGNGPVVVTSAWTRSTYISRGKSQRFNVGKKEKL